MHRSDRSVSPTGSLSSLSSNHNASQSKSVRQRYSPYHNASIKSKSARQYSDSDISSGSEADFPIDLVRLRLSSPYAGSVVGQTMRRYSEESPSAYQFAQEVLQHRPSDARDSIKFKRENVKQKPKRKPFHQRSYSLQSSYGYMLLPTPSGSPVPLPELGLGTTVKDTPSVSEETTPTRSTFDHKLSRKPSISVSSTSSAHSLEDKVTTSPPIKIDNSSYTAQVERSATPLRSIYENRRVINNPIYPLPGKQELFDHKPSQKRMVLVNPIIAAHLKRGGAVNVRSVGGTKSWKIYLPVEGGLRR